MARHDAGYKLLFSHAAVVADLLRGFVREDWVKEVDFQTLERVEGSYVHESLRARESDMLWKVRWRDRFLYVYILLEFQSSVDPHMALRVLEYQVLLYQDLLKQKAFTPSGKLPPVFILVLYNGKRPWQAASDVADLIEAVPGGLEAYRPHLRYALLDESQIPEMELESERNLAAALFRLEKSRDLEALKQEVGRLTAVPELDDSLRRSVRSWLTQVLIPAKFPGVSLAETGSLEEIHTMLAERVMEWTQEWKKEGLEEGLQQGRQQGRQDFLLSQIEERFGPLPHTLRHRIESIRDPEELKKIGRRLFAASSLDDLGL
ncbi:MAG TPA: Rpn family recombination-promoting nuclease/putative transposase [Thermoanaerobaculia bacterium]|jgi:predicted transposase/invertase (TIGR01784 family)|nr:Rpn family recombination-promoting nuclease/putative transposase [Thermoanaerobaculia bacterium]